MTRPLLANSGDNEFIPCLLLLSAIIYVVTDCSDIAISLCYWTNYTQEERKLSRMYENAVAGDRILKLVACGKMALYAMSKPLPPAIAFKLTLYRGVVRYL